MDEVMFKCVRHVREQRKEKEKKLDLQVNRQLGGGEGVQLVHFRALALDAQQRAEEAGYTSIPRTESRRVFLRAVGH